MVGSSRFSMLRAAIVQAVHAMPLARIGLRTSCETSRITTQAVSRLATIRSRWCGHCIVPAVTMHNHRISSQISGSVSGIAR
jgi:hypothetical protein